MGLGVDGEVGAEADEVRDQLEIAADEAKLAAEILLRIGHVTGTPSPLRCGRLAYKSWNHEGMGENGSFLRRFPKWELLRLRMHEELSARHQCH